MLANPARWLLVATPAVEHRFYAAVIVFAAFAAGMLACDELSTPTWKEEL